MHALPTNPSPAEANSNRPRSDKFPLFESFFFAGFEGTMAINVHGQWIDQITATAHDRHADEDYRRLREVGLFAARDSIRWPRVDQRGRCDFSSARPLVEASRRHGIAVIWDLFHYGYPSDLDPFTDEFVKRFAGYCYEAALFIRAHQDGPYYFTPVNEPSFLAWAGGEVARFAPHRRGIGPELKVALVRAAIAGINAIHAAVPNARIVNVDPICRVVAPRDANVPHGDAMDFNRRAVFEAWDMLSGRLYPELGGSRDHLDIVGVNYYWTNQWEIGHEQQPLALDDPRRVSLATLLRRVWKRYGGELLLTETAHADDMRPIWLTRVAEQCEQLLNEGVPLRGACLYPILGMPEWHEPATWTRMGLWDLHPAADTYERRPYEPMLHALREAQRLDRKFAEFRSNQDSSEPGQVAEPTGESLA
jgi:beta-glucosidase/6-phospho-beta-glucosidase/beta-galactosidase